MPQQMNLNSFIVLSHPGLKMCVSTKSRSHLILIQVSRFASHLPQVPWFHLLSIHVASYLNPDPYVCVFSPSMWRLTSIQAPKIASHFRISIPTTPSRIQDMCLISIQVLSHLDPGPKILVSPPYMCCLNPIQVHIVTSHLPQTVSQLHPGPDIHVSPQSRSRFTSAQIWRCTVHLYQCPVSPPTRPFTKVAFHLNPCPDSCISPPSGWRITSIKFPKFASQLHPGPITKPSRSQDVCLTSTQALSQIYPSYRILVSPPSKHRLASIQVPRFISHLSPSADIYVSHLTTS